MRSQGYRQGSELTGTSLKDPSAQITPPGTAAFLALGTPAQVLMQVRAAKALPRGFPQHKSGGTLS